MSDIKHLMYQLSEARSAAELLRMEKQSAIDSVIPDEVKAAIRDIELEYEDTEDAANGVIVDLEKQVKIAVSKIGESVKHAGLHAVFSAGRVSWDSKALDGYALNHPELFAFRKEGNPLVSIRVAK